MTSILLLLLLLQIKHLIADWLFQIPHSWRDKKAYLNVGVLYHAFFNAMGTVICFLLANVQVNIVYILLVDFIAHYNIDFIKMLIARKMGWNSENKEAYWWLTGIDQFLHQVTYLALIYFFVRV